MTGPELDKRMREILLNVTRETVLSSCIALTELGFSGRASFSIIEKCIAYRDKHPEEFPR
jgi:hypothetical protein